MTWWYQVWWKKELHALGKYYSAQWCWSVVLFCTKNTTSDNDVTIHIFFSRLEHALELVLSKWCIICLHCMKHESGHELWDELYSKRKDIAKGCGEKSLLQQSRETNLEVSDQSQNCDGRICDMHACVTDIMCTYVTTVHAGMIKLSWNCHSCPLRVYCGVNFFTIGPL